MAGLPLALQQLCSDLPAVSVPAGIDLIDEGAAGGRLFVLLDGTVRVRRGNIELATIDEPGAVFGEMSLLLGLPSTATVSTATDSRLYVIEDGASLLNGCPEIVLHLCRLLALRVHLLSGYLADLKAQFADHDNHLAMVHDILCGLAEHPHSDVRLGSDRLPDRAP